jgi:sec-independent protein translocase protein TatA
VGNLGVPEILVILVIALLVFGPEKVPEMARQLGKGMREVRRIQASLRSDVTGLLGMDDDDDDTPTSPFHQPPPPPAARLARPAPLRDAGTAAAAPSRFRTPGGGRVSTPAPAVVHRQIIRVDVVSHAVPRVNPPSRFRPPRRPDAGS